MQRHTQRILCPSGWRYIRPIRSFQNYSLHAIKLENRLRTINRRQFADNSRHARLENPLADPEHPKYLAGD